MEGNCSLLNEYKIKENIQIKMLAEVKPSLPNFLS